MATVSLKTVVQNSKFLSGLLKPVAKAYAGAAGYQQIGKSWKKKESTKAMLCYIVFMAIYGYK